MRVLITGASGFVGANLARAHVAAGDEVVALRHLRSLPPDLRGHVEERCGDLQGLDGARWPRVDVVYHCAALMADREEAPYAEFRRVNVDGTAQVLQAARAANAGRIVYVSTVGVLGPTTTPATESAPYGTGLTKYERSKREGEGVALAAVREGLPVVIVRPAQLYGSGMQHIWPRLIRDTARGRTVILGRGAARVHFTHVDDVIQGMRLAATVPRAVGQVYHLAAAGPVTVREAVESIAACLGVPKPRTVPYGPALAAATVLEWLPSTWRPGLLKMLTVHHVKFFALDRVYSIEKAKAELGYQPTHAWERTIAQIVAGYQQEERRSPRGGQAPRPVVGSHEAVA